MKHGASLAVAGVLTASLLFSGVTVSCVHRPRTPAQDMAGEDHHAAGSLHNVRTLPGSEGRLISGSSPDDDAAFDELSRRGVRTIISVDSGRPRLELAHARGMRYVHIPVGYNGITREQQLDLARAARDLPGQIYIHCHHGKHRGPAAGALAGVALGWTTRDDALTFMEEAGTAHSYAGLWSCVREARELSPVVIDAARGEFPEVAPVPGFTRAMVEMDEVFAHLRVIDAAGWRTPAEHPDLVPAAEAGRLADLFRACIEQGHAGDRDEDFARAMLRSLEASRSLEREIVSKGGAAALRSMLGEIGASCKDCHVKHRDRRAW